MTIKVNFYDVTVFFLSPLFTWLKYYKHEFTRLGRKIMFQEKKKKKSQKAWSSSPDLSLGELGYPKGTT